MASLQSIVDRRASALCRIAGFTPLTVPSLFEMAEALVGKRGIVFVGRKDAPGASLSSISVDRPCIRLQRGLPVEENVFAIARGLAQWDVGRGGCPIETGGVERFALSIALPLEWMEWFHAEGASHEEIARAACLPIDVVRARERAFVKLRSVPRADSAHDVAPDALPAQRVQVERAETGNLSNLIPLRLSSRDR